MEAIARVAAFVDGVLEGNPAGVSLVSGGDGFPPASEMLAAAARAGMAGTGFVRPLPATHAYEIRYFTPASEVALSGHTTMAAAFVLRDQYGRAAGEPLRFQAAGRVLTVLPPDADGLHWMDFPEDAPLAEVGDPVSAEVVEALGLPGALDVRRGRFDLLVRLPSERDVLRCRPSAIELAKLEARGVAITAAADDPGRVGYDFVSRFFAPAVGVAEDPVTGSAHCYLGPYWAAALGRDRLTGYQASDRGGIVHVDVVGGGRVRIGGRVRREIG